MYPVFRLAVRCALLLFCRRIVISGTVKSDGPLLLAANHPNGFLDGIVIASRFRRPVYFLGRGDLFAYRLIWLLLKPFHVVPLYHAGRAARLRVFNEEGLRACRKAWKNNGIVLVFVEGESKPVWGLRDMTKTAFRLSDPVIQTGGSTGLSIMPVGIHYHPFRGIKKQILIRSGAPATPVISPGSPAKRAADFQTALREKLLGCLSAGPDALMALADAKKGPVFRGLLALPALAGFVLHAPLYLPLKWTVNSFVRRPAFRESWLFLVLCLLYPVYWIGINVMTLSFFHHPVLICIFPAMPVWARCYILWRKTPG